MSDSFELPSGADLEDVRLGELLFAKAVDSFTDPMFIKDRRHRWVAGNAAFFSLLGSTRQKVLYKTDMDFFPREQAEVFWRNDDLLFDSGQPSENEEKLTGGDGHERTIWTRKYPLRDEAGQVIALSGIITDITSMRNRLEQAFRLEAAFAEQQRVIASQEALLSQLAVPVIQIWDGILLLPMVGELTAQRAAQVMESLLHAITEHRTRYALIDITGVPVVDATVASYLVKTVQAVRLLGCQSVTVGIGAAVAAQLVKIGVDVSSLTTQATLQQGLLYAIQQLSGDNTLFRGRKKLL
jgi:rsbT co-antagonist protein RsbR